jgi:hypothetical protein
VTYTVDGEEGTGFVCVAEIEGSVVAEVTSTKKYLSREEIEKLLQ